MPPEQQNEESTYADRLIALKLLRENLFFADPEKYGWTDIAEDMPGFGRVIGGIIKNVPPSMAIISKDPKERKKQIDAAVEKIKNSQKSKEGLKKEIIENAVNMGKGSIIPSLGLSLAFHLLGFRLPWANKWKKVLDPATGKNILQAAGKKFRLPIAPIEGLKSLFRPGRRHVLGKQVLSDTLLGAGLSAGAGALVPLAAHAKQVSPKALEEARQIIEKNPYMTSLPATELMSAIKQEKDSTPPSKTTNTLTGAGLGVAQGLAAALPALLLPGGKYLFSRLGAANAAKNNIIKHKLLREGKSLMLGGAGLGGALGAVSGYFNDQNVIDAEYEKIKEEKLLNEVAEKNKINSLESDRLIL